MIETTLILCVSHSTVLLQVVFGLPLAFRPSGVHPNAVKQSFSPSLLSTCPNQFHRLRRTSQLISLISAISTTLLFVTHCCYLIFIILLRHLRWKLFSFRLSAFVIFHASSPYSRTGRTKVLNRCILILLPIPLTAHTFPSLWNAPRAFCSRFKISLLPPPSLSTVAPRYRNSRCLPPPCHSPRCSPYW